MYVTTDIKAEIHKLSNIIK